MYWALTSRLSSQMSNAQQPRVTGGCYVGEWSSSKLTRNDLRNWKTTVIGAYKIKPRHSLLSPQNTHMRTVKQAPRTSRGADGISLLAPARATRHWINPCDILEPGTPQAHWIFVTIIMRQSTSSRENFPLPLFVSTDPFTFLSAGKFLVKKRKTVTGTKV